MDVIICPLIYIYGIYIYVYICMCFYIIYAYRSYLNDAHTSPTTFYIYDFGLCILGYAFISYDEHIL